MTGEKAKQENAPTGIVQPRKQEAQPEEARPLEPQGGGDAKPRSMVAQPKSVSQPSKPPASHAATQIIRKAPDAEPVAQDEPLAADAIDPALEADTQPPVEAAPAEAAAEKPLMHQQAMRAAPRKTVGWLVIIEGPGTGASVTLGYGKNILCGAMTDQTGRVAIDFGDADIDPAEAAIVTFDHLNGRFFITDGRGGMPSYVNRDVLLAPKELHARDELRIGGTVMLFVPFCGEAFSWEEKA